MGDKHISFNGTTTIRKQRITQTINPAAADGETAEVKAEYISARITPAEKAALNRIRNETGFTMSELFVAAMGGVVLAMSGGPVGGGGCGGFGFAGVNHIQSMHVY